MGKTEDRQVTGTCQTQIVLWRQYFWDSYLLPHTVQRAPGWLWRCFPSERHKECTDKWQESMVAVVLSCSLRIALLFDMLSPNFDGGALHYNARQHAYHAPRDSDSSRCSHRTTGTYNAEVASSSFTACSRFSIFGTAISHANSISIRLATCCAARNRIP